MQIMHNNKHFRIH